MDDLTRELASYLLERLKEQVTLSNSCVTLFDPNFFKTVYRLSADSASEFQASRARGRCSARPLPVYSDVVDHDDARRRPLRRAYNRMYATLALWFPWTAGISLAAHWRHFLTPSWPATAVGHTGRLMVTATLTYITCIILLKQDTANGYVMFMERLRSPISAEEVTAPSFSHTLKDPVEDDIVVRPHHRIVIIEGLYAFLAIDPWHRAGQSLDERWFIAVDPALGRERLCKRHVETGVAETWAEAEWRAENNDIPSKHRRHHFCGLSLMKGRWPVCAGKYAYAKQDHRQCG